MSCLFDSHGISYSMHTVYHIYKYKCRILPGAMSTHCFIDDNYTWCNLPYVCIIYYRKIMRKAWRDMTGGMKVFTVKGGDMQIFYYMPHLMEKATDL